MNGEARLSFMVTSGWRWSDSFLATRIGAIPLPLHRTLRLRTTKFIPSVSMRNGMANSSSYIPKKPIVTEEEAVRLAREYFPNQLYEFLEVRHFSDAFYYREIDLELGAGSYYVVFLRQNVKRPPLDLVTVIVNDQTGDAKIFERLL